MDKAKNEHIFTGRKLTDDFLNRTGISDPAGDPDRRYLWTDAFAVQSCFALYHLLDKKEYYEYALKLIDQVHFTLGRHRKDDHRKGWISGLSEEEGKKHPTAGGLRIGKNLPERPEGEAFNQQLEWERDGQYFHYLTRWFNALLQAYKETNEQKYVLWAAELIKAGENFIINYNGALQIVWKMDVKLTRPVVESMGAHDPMEGLICTISAIKNAPGKIAGLEELKKKMEILCRNMNWFTDDPLGIGGLMLNTVRTFQLSFEEETLPPEIQPENLYTISLKGLQIYSEHLYDPSYSAASRLAFRECGLTLGFHVLHGMEKKSYGNFEVNFDTLNNYLNVVHEIEEFWTQTANQKSPTWTGHLDINEITLSASLLSRNYPQAFS